MLKPLLSNPESMSDKYNQLAFDKINNLLLSIQKHKLSREDIDFLNINIDSINNCRDTGLKYFKKISKHQNNIIAYIKEHLKMVPRNYYKNKWMVMGMSIYGVSIGVIIGLISGEMALLALGLPIGMLIGIIIGNNMDRKAIAEGRQLDVSM